MGRILYMQSIQQVIYFQIKFVSVFVRLNNL